MAASLLAGCGDDGGGGGGGDSYCDALKSTQKEFESFEDSDFSSFDEFTDRVDEFADDAPDEVKDDWKILADALKEFVGALEDAGLTPEDLEGMQSGEVPEGVDMEALTEAMTQAQALGSEAVQKATENIEKHAKEECNIEFSAS
jgi:hypothetical protein